MYVIVTTMGIHTYNEIKLREREIEVKALVALANYGVNDRQKWKALAALEKIAYPNELAESIE
jgi:hypothetical protein